MWLFFEGAPDAGKSDARISKPSLRRGSEGREGVRSVAYAAAKPAQRRAGRLIQHDDTKRVTPEPYEGTSSSARLATTVAGCFAAVLGGGEGPSAAWRKAQIPHVPGAKESSFMALELVSGALQTRSGVVRYHAAFGEH